MLRVFVGNRLLFKLRAKALVFAQYLLMLSVKPIVFVLEALQLFPELDYPLLLDGGRSVLSNEFVEGFKQSHDHAPKRRTRGFAFPAKTATAR